MKKRILSLILALSMVLSVLPLGAFAADPPELVMKDGLPDCSEGTSGDGWEYKSSRRLLILRYGAFDFSSTHPQKKTPGTPTTTPVACEIVIESGVEITGGTFNGQVANERTGTISDGIFNGYVENSGTINNGTFAANKEVKNYGTINNGTFAGNVRNERTIENGTFKDSVINLGTIKDGTFNGEVQNSIDGKISGGAFSSTVYNYSGTIENGTFKGSVANYRTISGGTFAGGVNNSNDSLIFGGVFNGDMGFGGYPITVDEASPGAKIEKVNGVPAVWDPYVVIDGDALPEVTITASTDIYSLNGKSLSTNPYSSSQDNSDKTTVKFTMPKEGVTIGCGGLVMENGYPVGSNGNGWSYDNNTQTLTLTDGTYDFSYTYPQNSNGAGAEPVACAVETQLRVKITGGTFEGEVINNDLGVISGGTFHEKVSNSNGMITGGTFKSSVTSKGYGRIFGGVFNGNATLTNVTGLHSITVASGAKIKEVNGMSADWDPYVVVTENATTNEVIITADTEIFSLNGKSIGDGNCKSSYDGSDYKTVKFTMPGEPVVLNGAITCTDLVMEKGWPKASNGGKNPCKGNGWEYKNGTLYLYDGMYDFSTIRDGSAVECKIEISSMATITGGTFTGTVTNSGTINDGTFNGAVKNNRGINSGTFNETVTNEGTITGGVFKGVVENDGQGKIVGGTFTGSVNNKNNRIYGGVFNGKTGLDSVTGVHSITVASNAKIEKVNGVPADWKPYVVTSNATAKEVTITADTDIYSLNGYPIDGSPYTSSYPKPNDKTTVTFTMPNENVVLGTGGLVMAGGYPVGTSGNGWSYDNNTQTLTLKGGPFDFSLANPQDTTNKTPADSAVACAIEIQSGVEITGGTFNGKVTNNDGGMISGGTFQETCSVTNNGTIKNGTFKNKCSVENNNTIENGTFAGSVTNSGTVTGGVFNGNATLINVTGGHNITWDAASSKAKIEKVNGVSADWAPYVVTSNATTKEVTITADTEIFSLNGQPIGTGNCNSSYGVDKKTVTFTMPDDDVVLNRAITSTDLVMENGYPKDSNGGKTPCKGDGWEYIKNDPTNGDMLLLTGSNQTGGLFDFSTIGDGSAVECNVFVGKPTAITGGEFNGKVINNSHILGGTFHGEVDNTTMGTIEKGTFHGAVENNGMIENGTFHDAVKNNGTINDGAFNGKVENNSVINSGTFNGEVVNTTMGRIENGTFNDAVENNGTIENGTFHDAVKNNGIINGGTFNGAVTNNGTISGNITGSGTLNGEPITKTPEPEPEPEPTTYTVTVIGGTIDGKTSVSAKENDTLTVVLDQNDIPDGMTFDMWSISSDKLSGDINVDYRAEAMTFQMPAEDVTIRAQYRSAEIIEDAAPSPLATAATIAVGGAAAGIVVWQGVSLGVDLYLTSALPQGVPVPTDRRALALLLWETAGKPEVALPTLYGDIPAEEIELQKATRWAIQNGLMDAADKKDASFFAPDHYVTKMDVFGAWLRLKKLLGTT